MKTPMQNGDEADRQGRFAPAVASQDATTDGSQDAEDLVRPGFSGPAATAVAGPHAYTISDWRITASVPGNAEIR